MLQLKDPFGESSERSFSSTASASQLNGADTTQKETDEDHRQNRELRTCESRE